MNASRAFLQSAARDFRRTGALAPSSQALAAAMTAPLACRGAGRVSVLEVGAGTGSITREILRHLGSGDRLDAFEIHPMMAALLRQRFRSDPPFSRPHANVRIHCAAVQTLDRRQRYDFIVSCLPFTNFEPETVRGIFELYRSVLAPGGVLSFYEYLLVRRAARLVSGSIEGRRRVAGVARIVREYVGRYGCGQRVVFLNLPPATVHQIRFDALPGPAQ